MPRLISMSSGHGLPGLELDQAADGAAHLQRIVAAESLDQRRDGGPVPPRDERGDGRVTHQRILRPEILHQPGIVALPGVELHPRLLHQPVHDLVQRAAGRFLSALESVALHRLAAGGLQRNPLDPILAAAADAERGGDLLGSRQPGGVGLLLDRVHLQGEAHRSVHPAARWVEQLEATLRHEPGRQLRLHLRRGERQDLRLGEGGGDHLHPLDRVRRRLAPGKQHQPGSQGRGPQHSSGV